MSIMVHALREDRDRRGLTQEEYADFLGYHRLTIVRWETGKRRVSPRALRDIQQKTGIPARKLRPDLAKILEGV